MTLLLDGYKRGVGVGLPEAKGDILQSQRKSTAHYCTKSQQFSIRLMKHLRRYENVTTQIRFCKWQVAMPTTMP